MSFPRARLFVRPLEDRTVPSVTAQNITGDLLLTGDGAGNDVTVTEVGPQQFQVTGNNGTQIVDKNGNVLPNGLTATLDKHGIIQGVFGFEGSSDDHVTFSGTGQTLVSSINLEMWNGTDTVDVSGLQASALAVDFGAKEYQDHGDDTVRIDSSYVGYLKVDSSGPAGLDLSLTHFVGGEPSAPAGAAVAVRSAGVNGDIINLSSIAVFGSVTINALSQADVTVDGSGGTADQGLITAGLAITASAAQPSQVTVANLSVGQAAVTWFPAGQVQTGASTIALTNVDSARPITVDASFDPRKFPPGVFAIPTALTVTACSAPQFTYKPNNLASTVGLSGCSFSGLTLGGGTAADAFTVDGCSIGKAATIDAGGGSNTVGVTNSSFGGAVQLGAGTGDDTFTVTNDSFASLQFNGSGGTNTFNLTGSSVAGKLNLLGGPGDDHFTLDGIMAGTLTYAGGDGYNPFTLKGHSHVFGNASLTGGAGTDRIEIEQTDFGSTAAGKAAGGNLKIKTAGGTNDQVLLGYTVTTTNDSDANHILGGLTVTGVQGQVQLGFTKVRGATLISMTDPAGNDELDVNADTFYGRFTYSSHSAGTFAEIGEYAYGASTTFYGGVDLSGITGQSVINLATVSPGGDHSGPVAVYGTFEYKMALNVGANFRLYKF